MSIMVYRILKGELNMSYSSKKNLISLAAGILLVAGYAVFALGGRAPEPGDLRGWAVAMLVFVGISVAAMIVLQILFHIWLAVSIAVKEKECDGKEVERVIKSSMVEDERDKLIGMKASRIGYFFAGFGSCNRFCISAEQVTVIFFLSYGPHVNP